MQELKPIVIDINSTRDNIIKYRNLLAYALLVIAVVFAIAKVQSLTHQLARQEQVTCERQNYNARGVVDLGNVIKAARAVSANDPNYRGALADLGHAQIQTFSAPARRVIIDLEIIVGAARHGHPQRNYFPLLRAEDRYIKDLPLIKAPRSCANLAQR